MADITIMPEGKAPWSRQRSIGVYGGSLDKLNSDTEGDVPYAWAWYRMIQTSRGSAYRKELDGLVHAETIAIARSEAARTRAAEKLAANSEPNSSDEKLDSWAIALGVKRFPADTLQDLRARCASKRKAAVGPTIANVDQAVEELLGLAFVRTWRQEGDDLANPPEQTFWPGVNPGPAEYSLGGGTWLSERCHLLVEMAIPESWTTAFFLEAANTHLFQLLDRMLPSWATFSWTLELGDTGFRLDIDDLDFKGMIP